MLHVPPMDISVLRDGDNDAIESAGGRRHSSRNPSLRSLRGSLHSNGSGVTNEDSNRLRVLPVDGASASVASRGRESSRLLMSSAPVNKAAASTAGEGEGTGKRRQSLPYVQPSPLRHFTLSGGFRRITRRPKTPQMCKRSWCRCRVVSSGSGRYSHTRYTLYPRHTALCFSYTIDIVLILYGGLHRAIEYGIKWDLASQS